VEYDVRGGNEEEKKDWCMRSSESGLAVELQLFRCRKRVIFNVF
jgi:hypothetical protein